MSFSTSGAASAWQHASAAKKRLIKDFKVIKDLKDPTDFKGAKGFKVVKVLKVLKARMPPQMLRAVFDQGSLPARSDGVVISGGTGRPSICNAVGATALSFASGVRRTPAASFAT